MSLNKVRKAAKIAPATKAMISTFIKKCLDDNSNVVSVRMTQPQVPQREKGRPTKRELSEAVDLLYADCSEVDVLSPDRTILDEPEPAAPQKPHEGLGNKVEDQRKDS